MIRRWLLLLLLAWPMAAPGAARGAESARVRSARLTATLVSDTDAAAPGVPLRLGLRLRMAPGWHTYWRNPGDAGAPAELALTLPPGATAGEIAWPTPERLPEGPLMSYAYTGEVVLPVAVTPGPGGLAIAATANWLVCATICVPEEGRFTLTLPPGPPSAAAEAPLFAAAEARLPRPSPYVAAVAPDGSLSLSGAGLSAASVSQAWFFPDASGVIEPAALQSLTVRDGSLRLALTPAAGFAASVPLTGTVVLRGPGGGERFLAIAAGAGPVPAAAMPLGRTLLFALLGGLMLNLMPCVFPVLAMKAMAIARLSGQARGAVRAHALSYTAGVLLAFAALGGAVLAFGSAVGWGFQFQSPVFVAGTALLLFAVGLNLSGVFRIGSGLAGAGQAMAGQGGHVGSFFTGLLAVLVATPCTAPFMGAAVAAAVAGPPVGVVAVFLAMGLGLAAPYAVLAALPGLARRLPRPGPWMDLLRGGLAFPMYGAAAWLLWVISLQAGPDGVLATGSALVLLGLGAWSLGSAETPTPRARRVAWTASGVAWAVAILLVGNVQPTAPRPGPAGAAADGIEAFSRDRLAALRAERRPVFVNMTAAWCVSCLVNERIALSAQSVRQAFADRHVAYLKGDWTNGDPEITGFLRQQGREGVPLYLLYAPGAAEPAVLPQILTPGEVLSRLDRLGG